MYPSRIFLVRGNHEFEGQNEVCGDIGFKAQLQERLPTKGLAAYAAVHEALQEALQRQGQTGQGQGTAWA